MIVCVSWPSVVIPQYDRLTPPPMNNIAPGCQLPPGKLNILINRLRKVLNKFANSLTRCTLSCENIAGMYFSTVEAFTFHFSFFFCSKCCCLPLYSVHLSLICLQCKMEILSRGTCSYFTGGRVK